MYARCLLAVTIFLALVFPALGEELPAPGAAAKSDPVAVAKWRKQLLECRKLFVDDGPNREALWVEGREKIAGIDDPAAVPVIVGLVKSEKHPQFRRALVVPLVKLGGKEAIACLVKLSVEDDNPLLREEAAKGLAGKPELEGYLDTYIAYLKSPKFVANAAEALIWSQLGMPNSQSQTPNEKLTKALINAIHTYQYKVVPYRIAYDTGLIPKVNSNGAVTYGYARGVDDGMIRVRVPVPQPKVVAALKESTGQDYQYDQSGWRSWLVERLAR